jgi:hypothetical protein
MVTRRNTKGHHSCRRRITKLSDVVVHSRGVRFGEVGCLLLVGISRERRERRRLAVRAWSLLLSRREKRDGYRGRDAFPVINSMIINHNRIVTYPENRRVRVWVRVQPHTIIAHDYPETVIATVSLCPYANEYSQLINMQIIRVYTTFFLQLCLESLDVFQPIVPHVLQSLECWGW